MIPRFSNPHLLPQVSQIVSRSQIYASHDCGSSELTEYDQGLCSRLNEHLERSLSQPRLESERREGSEESAFRSDSCEESILFRLVSSALPPLPILISPPPPPPSLTREPDAEDSEEHAILRQKCAEVASIDAEAILRESKQGKYPHQRWKPPQSLRAVSTYAQTNLIIVRKLQQPRKTRPPVPLSSLSRYPYVSEISTLPQSPVKSRMMDISVIDVEDAQVASSMMRKRSRSRRRKLGVEAEGRPPPRFWKAHPAWEGKCRGYAYGYPSNLTCRSGVKTWRYKRDSMKRAVYANS